MKLAVTSPGTNRLERRLGSLVGAGQTALAPYVTAGDGGLERTLAVLRALDRPDVACVELGLPFSDPIADGPELQAAAERALAAGTTFDGVLEMLRQLRAGTAGAELPILIMSYANPLVRRGWSEAVSALAGAGADGLIVADLPIDEGGPMIAAAREADLCPVFLAAPNSSAERLARIAAASRGFVYAIGRFGVTGQATSFDDETGAFIARLRRAAGTLPVALGFGIRDAAGVAGACAHADLAVVGSAFVASLHQHVERSDPERDVTAFFDRLATGLHQGVDP